MNGLNIFDICQALDTNGNKPTNPLFDARLFDKKKVNQLLSLDLTFMLDERFNEPETLVLCSYEGETFFIDENANLWDIYKTGELSMLSVGHLGYGIDGFVVDLLAENLADDELKEHFSFAMVEA